jgi:hypothetical protein
MFGRNAGFAAASGMALAITILLSGFVGVLAPQRVSAATPYLPGPITWHQQLCVKAPGAYHDLFLAAPDVWAINRTAGWGNDQQNVVLFARVVDENLGATDSTPWFIVGGAVANDNAPAKFPVAAQFLGLNFVFKHPNHAMTGWGDYRVHFMVAWYAATDKVGTSPLSVSPDTTMRVIGFYLTQLPGLGITWGNTAPC